MDSNQLLSCITVNLRAVREQIARAADRREVALICVTKYAEDEWIRALVAAGATDLAENLLPRAAERFASLTSEGLRFTRHLVGAPQSRKVKLICGQFDWVQAVDRVKIARMLQELLEQRGETINALLQVNIAEEPQKHGVPPQQAPEVFNQIREECPALQLRGLMAVPPWPEAYANDAEFERGTRLYFGQMRTLFDKIRAECRSAPVVDTLSLGMSLDYVWAVEEGATMVRVGSALFAGLAD